METIGLKIAIYCLSLMACFAVLGCNDDNESALSLDGDAWLTEFSADGYVGVINNVDKTVTLALPEVYDTNEMDVTSVQVSEGASASMRAGDKINLSFPQMLVVTNGDVFLDYTIKVRHDEAKIISFRLNDVYIGSIDEENHKITVRIPTGVDIRNLVPTVETSTDAIVSPVAGMATDFTNPVDFTVTYNTASAVYSVKVIQSDSPEFVYVGLSSTLDDLNPEEKTAATWMMNKFGAQYVSFDDIRDGNIDLSNCHLMWWHLHIDGGIDTMDKFDAKAASANNAIVKMKDFLNRGGSLLLTRFATYYVTKLGLLKDGSYPNNCWGQSEESAEITTEPWSFSNKGHETHPIYQNLLDNEDSKVYTCDANYRITNSTAQWHIGSDWGGYPTIALWREKTGGTDLGYGGDGAVVVWEFLPEGTKGGVVCIGSGCYDWYAVGMNASDKYHVNVETLTNNAINYLTNSNKK